MFSVFPSWQVPIVGRLGFEPTALGVSQATLAILQYHGEAQAAPEMNKFHCHEVSGLL